MKNTQQTSQSPKPAQAQPSAGQKRITLSVALKAHPTHLTSVEITFGELCRAYMAVNLNEAIMHLRKWVELLSEQSAWGVSPEELARAGNVMIDNGYSPSSVNRNFSQIGSVYRWAKRQMLTPPGFVSPTSQAIG